MLIDGERLDDEALSAPSVRSAGAVELRCVSADPRMLVAESFAGVADALVNARQSQKLAAESLQTGKLDEAFNELQAALEVWDAVHRVTDHGPALLGVTLAHLGTTGQSLDADLGRLSRTLAQVKEAVGGQDWSTLADLLSHELDDAAERWGGLLSNLGTAARSVPVPGAKGVA
ncbi:MAG: hypothetical protein QM783_15040 [Phycisphaerales bacterium]